MLHRRALKIVLLITIILYVLSFWIVIINRTWLRRQGNAVVMFENASESTGIALEEYTTLVRGTDGEWAGSATGLVQKKLMIAIVVTADSAYRGSTEFSRHADSVECYARARGYYFLHIPEGSLFKRHQVVRANLAKYDWILFLDGDVQMLNYGNGLERHIETAQSTDIVFPTRFINGEVAAGAYLVRNSSWSLEFLRRWSEADIIGTRVGNADNGFLLQLLTQSLFVHGARTAPELAEGEKCVQTFNGHDGLMAGKCCLSALMGAQRRFEHVLLLPRGQGFMRDDFVSTFLLSDDIGVHNKGTWNAILPADFYRHGNGSCKNIQGAVLDSITPPQGMQQYAVCYNDHAFAASAPHALFAADVWDCFPKCHVDLEAHKLRRCLEWVSISEYQERARTNCDHLKLNFTPVDWQFHAQFVPYWH
jgi:hypothetical protein